MQRFKSLKINYRGLVMIFEKLIREKLKTQKCSFVFVTVRTDFTTRRYIEEFGHKSCLNATVSSFTINFMHKILRIFVG